MPQFFSKPEEETKFIILSLDKISAEQRPDFLELITDCYNNSAFVGLGEDEKQAILSTEKNSSRSFYLLFSGEPATTSFAGIVELVWKDGAVEIDGLYVPPSCRRNGAGTLLVILSVYFATANMIANHYSSCFLEINILDTNTDVSKLIEPCKRLGTRSIYTQDGRNYPAYNLRMDLSLLLDHSGLFASLGHYVNSFVQSPTPGKVNLGRQTNLLHQLEDILIFGGIERATNTNG